MPPPPNVFRPRGSISAPRLADVRDQMLRVRRRRNRHVLLREGSRALGAVLTALVILAVLVPLASRGTFVLAFWALALLTALVIARSFRKIRSDRIPRRTTALAIDREARLDDRLATLSAFLDRQGQSRLWRVLVDDNLKRLPVWMPERIVPRALPRDVAWPVVAGVLLLVLLAGLRLPEIPGLRPGGRAGLPAGAKLVPADGAVDSASGPFGFLAQLPEELREALRGEATAGASGALAALGQTEDGEAPENGLPRPPSGSEGKALDGAMGPGEGEGEGSGNDPGPTIPDEAGDGESEAAGFRRLPLVEARPGAEERRAGDLPGSGGAGAGGGTDAGGLYGDEGVDAGSTPSGYFPFDLAAEGRPVEGDGEEDAAPPSRPAADLADEQALDDAIRRAQVPPEYEGVVQRMFSRREP